MKCPECESTVIDDAIFCHACGKRIGGGIPKRSRRRRRDDADTDFPSSAIMSRDFRRARNRLRSLTPNDKEVDIWRGTFAAMGLVNYWTSALAASIFLIVGTIVFASGEGTWPVVVGVIVAMWLFLFGFLIFLQLDVHYELTNQRLVHKTGILRRVTNRVEVIDIDDVTFEQGIIERLVGVGTIEVYSSDQTDPLVIMEGIDNVHEVAQLIDEARRAERVRRGIHIEAV